MAKNEPPRPKWYQAVFQAFGFVRQYDKLFLPLTITVEALIIGGAIALGILAGGIAKPIYIGIAGLLFAVLALLIILTNRIDNASFNMLEGSNQIGVSLRAMQMIRRGWKIYEEPAGIDPRGRAVTFYAVGRGGIVLASEGGAAARKVSASSRQRIARLAPGVPITEIYVGDGAGDIELRKLPRTIKSIKKVLSRRERTAVEGRLNALGSVRMPVPKGVDPMRARANRKALRGR